MSTEKTIKDTDALKGKMSAELAEVAAEATRTAKYDKVAGILHPNMKNRFQVQFFDYDETPLSYGPNLTRQNTAVYLPALPLVDGENYLLIDFEDDIPGLAMNGVLRLLNHPTRFIVLVEKLDGNENVVCTYKLTLYGVKIFVSELNYSPVPTAAVCTIQLQARVKDFDIILPSAV